jgi:CRISPR-associated protein Cas2
MMVLVSYDVSTVETAGRRRLRRVAKLCTSWGQRVQRSVFECDVDPGQWTRLRDKLVALTNPEEDSLRFYFLGNEWQRRVEHIGAHPTLDLRNDPLVV